MVGAVDARISHVLGPRERRSSTSRSSTRPTRASHRRDTSAPVARERASDFTVRVTVEGLAPATRYYYRMLVDGESDRYRRLPFATRTAPAGAGVVPASPSAPVRATQRRSPSNASFDAIARAEPDLFFWLGDNIYGDTASDRRARGRLSPPAHRRLDCSRCCAACRSSRPGTTTTSGSTTRDRPSPVRDVSLAVFSATGRIQPYGLEDAPGVFFEYAYGGVDFFFLDGRYHRDPERGSGRAGRRRCSGTRQKRLAARGAAARVARRSRCSSAAAAGRSSDGPQGDTWAAFLTERNELFDFIRDSRIGGVV